MRKFTLCAIISPAKLKLSGFFFGADSSENAFFPFCDCCALSGKAVSRSGFIERHEVKKYSRVKTAANAFVCADCIIDFYYTLTAFFFQCNILRILMRNLLRSTE